MLWTTVFLLSISLLLGLLLVRARFHARAATAELRDHLTRAPLAVIEWGPEWRIVRWEGEAERIFGYPAAEVLGQRLADLGLVHPDDRVAVDAVGQQLTAGHDRIIVSKNRNLTRDGRTIHCEWYNSVALDSRGEVASMLSFVVDVTAQRNAEEQLRRTQRLEEIGRLAGGVAHETNNQMSVVLGFASQVAKGPNLTAEQRADLEEVRRAAERVAAVTRQLLAFSRQQVLRPEPVDLGAEVRAASAPARAVVRPRPLARGRRSAGAALDPSRPDPDHPAARQLRPERAARDARGRHADVDDPSSSRYAAGAAGHVIPGRPRCAALDPGHGTRHQPRGR